MTIENIDLNEISGLNTFKKDVTVKPLDIDSIFKELGDFGKFQFKNYFFICLVVILYSSYTLSFIITTGNLDYR